MPSNKTKKYLTKRKGGMPPKKHKQYPAQNIKLSSNDIIEKLEWNWIAKNPGAMPLIKKHMDKITITALSENTNPEAVEIVANNLDKLENWHGISKNPSAIHILETHKSKISWEYLFDNPNPKALELIKELTQKSRAVFTAELKEQMIVKLSKQPYALDFLKENPQYIFFGSLCQNPNPGIIPLIKENLGNEEKINFYAFRELWANPGACDLLQEIQEEYSRKEEEKEKKASAKTSAKTSTKSSDIKLNRQQQIQVELYTWLAKNPKCLSVLPEKYLAMMEHLGSDSAIFWRHLSLNPSNEAIEMLDTYSNKIVWDAFAQNPNPDTIPFFRKQLTKVGENFGYLCANPNAIELIGDYYADDINWQWASKNPKIMELIQEVNYQRRKEAIKMKEGTKEPKTQKQRGLPEPVENEDWLKEVLTYIN